MAVGRPCRAGRDELFAYHAGSRTLIPFKSDAPGAVREFRYQAGSPGRCRFFTMKGGVPVGPPAP